MVDPTTVNTSLAIPIRGTDVGTWDLPANGNFTAIDSMFGGVTTVALSSQSVTLLSSQAQASVIRLTGTLLANVSVILPSIYKGWTIDNRILNSPSSFAIILVSTNGASYIGLPPSTNDVFYDGTTVDYRNLGKVGEYWDYASLSIPSWVLQSQKPPYLYCNGTTFSSATYPILANLFGGNTLPDTRGRVRIQSNNGTGRVTVIAVDTLFAAGGDQNLQAHNHTASGTTSGQSVDHTHTGSGTTSSESVDHTHTGSGTTATQNANHTHTGSGTTSGYSADHTHTVTGPLQSSGVSATPAGPGFSGNATTFTTSGQSNDHTHTYSFTTSIESATHAHTYSFTTSGVSNAHTHTYSFTTSG